MSPPAASAHPPDTSTIRAAIDLLYDAAPGGAGVEHVPIHPYIGARYFEPGVLRVMVVGINAYIAAKDQPKPDWFRNEFDLVRGQKRHADGSLPWLFNRRVADEIVGIGEALVGTDHFHGLASVGLDGAYITNAVKAYLPHSEGARASDVGDDVLDRYHATWLEECRLLAETPPHAIVVLGERWWWPWACSTFMRDGSRPAWATGYRTLKRRRVSIVTVTTAEGSYSMPLMRVDHPAARRKRVTGAELAASEAFRAYFGAGCSICGRPDDRGAAFRAQYPMAVCTACDLRGLNSEGRRPAHESNFDSGDNPVFIDGHQCWRRYRFGGYVTMRDPENATDVGTFFEGWL